MTLYLASLLSNMDSIGVLLLKDPWTGTRLRIAHLVDGDYMATSGPIEIIFTEWDDHPAAGYMVASYRGVPVGRIEYKYLEREERE